MNLKSLVYLLIAAALAARAIFYGMRSPPQVASTLVVSPTMTVPNNIDDLATWRAENQRLGRNSIPPPPDLAGPEKRQRVIQLQALAELKKSKLVNNISTPLLDVKGKFSAEFFYFFILTAKEQSAMQRALEEAQAKIDVLESVNASVESKNEGTLWIISVRPFPEGAKVYDELMDTIARTMGKERMEAFQELSEPALVANLQMFGAETRTITLQHTGHPDGNGAPIYEIYDARKTIADQGGPESSLTSWMDRPKMLQRFGRLAQLLPSEF